MFLASAYGLVPDEWQENVLEGWLGVRPDGKWAAPRCGLAVPRQNGKNGVIEVRELHGMVTLGERFLHTAHEVKTARKAFTRLLSFFENDRKFPELAALVKEIRKTNGQEAIFLTNGGSVEFVARSKGSGRGFSVDVLVMDEAQDLSEEAYAALLPTISASPNPQQIMTGTPPGPTATGDAFTRLRSAGVEGKDRRLCWMEWGCLAGVDMDDLNAWAQANPALGIRLTVEFTAGERGSFTPATFGRERLGMWDEVTGSQMISDRDWARCFDPDSQIVSTPQFALDVSPARSWSAIAAGGKNAAGVLHGEVTERGGLVDHRERTEWVVPRLRQLRESFPGLKLHIAAGSAAKTLVPEIEGLGIAVVIVPTQDVVAGCGLLFDLATAPEPGLAHLGTPELARALSSAKKQQENGERAWVWGRKRSAADITPLYALTLALWAAHQAQTADYSIADSIF